jgi:hypothetical protein
VNVRPIQDKGSIKKTKKRRKEFVSVQEEEVDEAEEA